MAVVGAPVGVLADEPLERIAAEEPAISRSEQQVLRQRAELIPEPAVERDAEAGLSALGRLRWQVRSERLPQRLFPAREAGRQGESELHDAAVEEGRAELERDRHRGDV